MQHQQDWEKQWKTVDDASKQRKYRGNAPLHVRKKFLHARLSDKLQSKIGVKQAAIRVGDTVEVMRGDWRGIRGEVTDIDYDNYKVFVDGVELEANDGTTTEKPVDPSNLLLTEVKLTDDRRLKHADEEGRADIQQQQEEEQEEEPEEGEDVEMEEDAEEAVEEASPDTTDYTELVDNTITDAKDKLQGLDDPDFAAALEAEQNGKDRSTFTAWLENQQDKEDVDGEAA